MKKINLLLVTWLLFSLFISCDNEKGEHRPDRLATSLIGCWEFTEGEEMVPGTLNKKELSSSDEFRIKCVFDSDNMGFIARNNNYTYFRWTPSGAKTVAIYPNDDKENYELFTIIAVLDNELILEYTSNDNMYFKGNFDRSDLSPALYNRSKFVGNWKLTGLTGWNMDEDVKYPVDIDDSGEEIHFILNQTSFSTMTVTNKETNETATENFFWAPRYDFIQMWPYKGNQDEDSSIYYLKEITDYTLTLFWIEENEQFFEMTFTKR